MLVNKRGLTELNYKHLTAGESGEESVFLLEKTPKFTPKMAAGKLRFGNSERMRNCAMEKSESQRICTVKTHFKVTFLDQQIDTKKKKKCSANPL